MSLIIININLSSKPQARFFVQWLTGKYTMGPIWDVDRAFGYEGSNRHFNSYLCHHLQWYAVLYQ